MSKFCMCFGLGALDVQYFLGAEKCLVFKILLFKKTKKHTHTHTHSVFPSGIFRGIFVEQQTGMQSVYFVRNQNQIPQNLSCLLSQRKIVCGAEIWEQIVYKGYSDVKLNTMVTRASKEIPLNRRDVMH